MKILIIQRRDARNDYYFSLFLVNELTFRSSNIIYSQLGCWLRDKANDEDKCKLPVEIK